jgi:hypothetical protein
MLINELRTEYSNPRAEFVEFKTLEAGNLGALRLFIIGSGKDPLVFEFPPAEVAAGEYILLHLRVTDSGSVAVNETGPDLGFSGGTEALETARDFWVPGSAKLLHKTDVVYLTDQNDRIIDALMISEIADSWWSKEEFVESADLLYRQEAWISSSGKIPGPQDAMITAGSTLTRSICREESVPDHNDAGDWYIAATSNATPGAPNCSRHYE